MLDGHELAFAAVSVSLAYQNEMADMAVARKGAFTYYVALNGGLRGTGFMSTSPASLFTRSAEEGSIELARQGGEFVTWYNGFA